MVLYRRRRQSQQPEFRRADDAAQGVGCHHLRDRRARATAAVGAIHATSAARAHCGSDGRTAFFRAAPRTSLESTSRCLAKSGTRTRLATSPPTRRPTGPGARSRSRSPVQTARACAFALGRDTTPHWRPNWRGSYAFLAPGILALSAVAISRTLARTDPRRDPIRRAHFGRPSCSMQDGWPMKISIVVSAAECRTADRRAALRALKRATRRRSACAPTTTQALLPAARSTRRSAAPRVFVYGD